MQACENIGPRQRAKRIRLGALLLAAGLLLVGVLVLTHAERVWRLAAFPLWCAGSIGLLQVPARTCVSLAARGLRDMDDGEQAVSDPVEQRQLQRQARRVMAQGFALAAVLTALAWALA